MSEEEIQKQMDAMRALDEPMPQVGIFWSNFICIVSYNDIIAEIKDKIVACEEVYS